MKKCPYSAPWRYDRERVIYGICINTRSGKHYCFNRDYLVLPIQLPPAVVEAMKIAATSTVREGLDGHGRFRIDLGPGECMTYFLFNDGNPPKWNQRSREYDKSFYEKTPPE